MMKVWASLFLLVVFLLVAGVSCELLDDVCVRRPTVQGCE